MISKLVTIFGKNANFALLIKIFSTFDITLSTHHISEVVPWKLSFKQKYRHTDLPKTNRKEKHYNVCMSC